MQDLLVTRHALAPPAAGKAAGWGGEGGSHLLTGPAHLMWLVLTVLSLLPWDMTSLKVARGAQHSMGQGTPYGVNFNQ